MNVSADQLIELARYLGVGGALALLIVGVALWRQVLWIGPAVTLLMAERDLLMTEKDKQINERDRRIAALEQQVDDRQRALDRTLEVAATLRLVFDRGR